MVSWALGYGLISMRMLVPRTVVWHGHHGICVVIRLMMAPVPRPSLSLPAAWLTADWLSVGDLLPWNRLPLSRTTSITRAMQWMLARMLLLTPDLIDVKMHRRLHNGLGLPVVHARTAYELLTYDLKTINFLHAYFLALGW